MARPSPANKEVGFLGERTLSPRFLLVLSFIVITIALLWWWSNKQSITITNIEDENEVLLVLQSRSASESSRERDLKTRVQAFPNDIESVATLVQLYIERSRSESDPRYLGYAQHLLKPWWQKPAPPPPIQRLRAILLQGQHRFGESMNDLNALLERYPGDAQSLLTRATVHQVLGNYQAALPDCLNLSRYAPIPGVACAASILSLTGRVTDAQALMARIKPRLETESVSIRQWILTLQGEIAARGDQAAQAEQYYKLALNESMRSSYLLREYSQFLLHQNRAKEALGLLRDETYDDSLLLHAAIAANRIGDDRRRAEYLALIETRLRNAMLRGSTDHYYLAGRFALELEDLPVKAFQFSQLNWQNSKETRDTELYAAAAVAIGNQPAIEEIRHWMSIQNAVLPNVSELLNANENNISEITTTARCCLISSVNAHIPEVNIDSLHIDPQFSQKKTYF